MRTVAYVQEMLYVRPVHLCEHMHQTYLVSMPKLPRNLVNINLRLLYKAAETLQITGACHRLLLNRLVPVTLYEFLITAKHLSIIDLLDLNDNLNSSGR